MMGFSGPESETDPFTKFWSDIMAGMGGAAPQGSAQEDMLLQMRRTFFDAWAHQCEEFMRSDAFLAMMKQSMETALAFREKTNEFLNKTLNDAQMPSREDTDSIQIAIRTLQEQVLDRLDALSQRVEALEARNGRPPAKGKKS